MQPGIHPNDHNRHPSKVSITSISMDLGSKEEYQHGPGKQRGNEGL